MDDAEAVRLTIEGDPRGPEALIEKYQMDVYNLSLRMLGSAADAEDATQDVFVRAFARIHQYQPDRPFGAWIHGIARNRSLDLLRSRRPVEPHANETAGPAASGADTEGLALARIHAEAVRSALDRLPARDRALLVLRYWEDLPVEAVARRLNMTDGAARVALLRARRALAGRLRAAGVEGSDAV